MVIGVDIDGVLADQIDGIIPRIKERLGLDLRYEDIVEFRLALGSSDLSREIVTAMNDREYLQHMPLHEGAHDFLAGLQAAGLRVKVLTARPAGTERLTRHWLEHNALPYDELTHLEEGLKSVGGADILVDDYAGNVAEFLRETSGHAVLLRHPWNEHAPELASWEQSGRLHRAEDLKAATSRIREIVARVDTGRDAA